MKVKIKKTTLYINQMHCPSCEILINDKFREVKNIIDVKPSFKDKKVEVFYMGSLDVELLNKKIKKFGYEIAKGKIQESESIGKKIFEVFILGAIILVFYFLAKNLSLIPDFNFKDKLTLPAVFTIGLLASTSTCMATSGALYLSLVSQVERRSHNIRTALFFNLGRIIAYGFFGFLTGLFGQFLIANVSFTAPLVTLFAGLFMILLGLDMNKILSLGSIIPSSLNKIFFEKLKEKLITYPHKAPFFLGGATYILPCGFTQALQFYVLSLASPFQGALVMMVFALGTMPALMFIGGLTSFVKTNFYHYFMKTMGVLIIFVGLIYLSNFASFFGIEIGFLSRNNPQNERAVLVKDGFQIIKMKVVASGYVPNQFTIKKGIPVKWVIEGENVFGCQAYFIVPQLGIQRTIEPGENVIQFTPKEKGFINFACSMGMYRGRIEVVD